MRSVVIHPPHELRVEDRPLEATGPGQVTVAVKAGGIGGSDMHATAMAGSARCASASRWCSATRLRARSSRSARMCLAEVGDRVAVNPSRPCRACRYCSRAPEPLRGDALLRQRDAMAARSGRVPRTPRLRRGSMRGCAGRRVLEELALCEPLSVVLHGVKRAGSLLQKRVLVTGSGRSARWPWRRPAISAPRRSSSPTSCRNRSPSHGGSGPTGRSTSPRSRTTSRLWRPARALRCPVRVLRQRARHPRCARRHAAARHGRAARPWRERGRVSAQPSGREGTRAPRLLPLPQGIRARRQAHRATTSTYRCS